MTQKQFEQHQITDTARFDVFFGAILADVEEAGMSPMQEDIRDALLETKPADVAEVRARIDAVLLKHQPAGLIQAPAPDPEIVNSNLMAHARRELRAIGYIEGGSDYNSAAYESITELLGMFVKQGHSGFSANYCINVFNKLARFEPLSPLTGADDEWNEVGEDTWQNNRCSHVFKTSERAYDINGASFKYHGVEGQWSNKCGHVTVTFPYSPSTVVVECNEDDSDEVKLAAVAAALAAAAMEPAGQEPPKPASVTATIKQLKEVIALFAPEGADAEDQDDTEICLVMGDDTAHSGPGLYAADADYVSEGMVAMFDAPDSDEAVAQQAEAAGLAG